MAPGWIRPAAGLLTGGLVLGALTGCGGSNATAAGAGPGTGISSSTASSSSTAPSSAAAPSAGVSGSESAGSVAESRKNGSVTCAGFTCSATFTQTGTTVTLFGSAVTFESLHGGTATLRAGTASITCHQGDTAAAGRMKLTCSTVTDRRVTVTARLA